MVIKLNRKKILVISLALVIGIGVYLTSNKKVTGIPVNSTPVTSKVVILDARAWRAWSVGAESANGVTENEINLKITLKVQNLLEQAGSTVILTRSDENGIYNLDENTIHGKYVSDRKNRVQIGNNSDADIFVSIHLNKIPQQQYSGWQTFYRKNDDVSKNLATAIQGGLNKTMNKGSSRETLPIWDIYIVKKTELPISIVECGFLSNPEEEKLLQTEEYQDKLAWGIYIGIMDYFLLD